MDPGKAYNLRCTLTFGDIYGQIDYPVLQLLLGLCDLAFYTVLGLCKYHLAFNPGFLSYLFGGDPRLVDSGQDLKLGLFLDGVTMRSL